MSGRTPDPVTAEVVEKWARVVLEEWLDGYYPEELADGRQRSVAHWSDDVFIVDDFDGYHHKRKFRVKVTVEEVS